jgi:ATP-dependent DNA helicase RecG
MTTTNRQQIQNWLANGESETQEFKATTGQRTDATKTLSALLNQRGGRVLFGVTPDGAVRGQQVTDKTLEDLAQALRDIEPAADPTIERVAVDDQHQVIVVSVGRGPRRPYTYRGR